MTSYYYQPTLRTCRSHSYWFCLIASIALSFPLSGSAAPDPMLSKALDQAVIDVQPQVIAWRRDIHQHPELSNREVRTAKLVADQLRSLGLEVRTGVAHTGVIGILRGDKPGPVIALRADMDALPVKEQTGLPFASTATAEYLGKTVPVAHACGHDAHTAILLGAATVLSRYREQLKGTVVFLFQPAEEGAPPGEEGGAELMVKQGALENPKPDAVFGLHVSPSPFGSIAYRAGVTTAASDTFYLDIHGRQTHGAIPWRGIDPFPIMAQTLLGWQLIPARHTDIMTAPAPVISAGTVKGGQRHNIIPDLLQLSGTIRTFGTEQREHIHRSMKHTAQHIAESEGGTAELRIDKGYPSVVNDPALLSKVLPTLKKVAYEGVAIESPPGTGAEDFSYFSNEVPGLYFVLGTAPKGADLSQQAPNHSPEFTVDESALRYGVRAFVHLVFDFADAAKQ